MAIVKKKKKVAEEKDEKKVKKFLKKSKKEEKQEVDEKVSVKRRRWGIMTFMRELLAKDPDIEYAKAEKLVKEKFPESRFNAKHLSWYKYKIVRSQV